MLRTSDSDLAIPKKDIVNYIDVDEADANETVEKLMSTVEAGVEFIDIRWDVKNDRGVLTIIDNGKSLELYLKNREALFKLNIALYSYYLRRNLNVIKKSDSSSKLTKGIGGYNGNE